MNLITGSDQLYLSNLTKTIFRGYLDSYINVECRYLNDKCASVLQRYYADKGHQKKASASAAGTVVQVRVLSMKHYYFVRVLCWPKQM